MSSHGAAPYCSKPGVLAWVPSSAPFLLPQWKLEALQVPYRLLFLLSTLNMPKMKGQQFTFNIPRTSATLATSPTWGIFMEPFCGQRLSEVKSRAAQPLAGTSSCSLARLSPQGGHTASRPHEERAP